MISIVVPALNEAHGIAETLRPLQPYRGGDAEIIVVDGGSTDATKAVAAPLADRVLDAPRGRASQMNAGARIARGDTLLFLHADTRLPPKALQSIALALSSKERVWGRFDVRIDERGLLLGVVAAMMNARSRRTGIATGDQAIFVARWAFDTVGGFPEIPLMEDVALSGKLNRLSSPACLRQSVVTSGRRWRDKGTLRTIVLMWRLRLAFALGADPEALARRYDAGRGAS